MSDTKTPGTRPGEFELIGRYFAHAGASREEVQLGQGDDAALIKIGGQTMAVCTDTMVAGRHFLAAQAPRDIGYKSLAVNLSDLAAMGAQPMWAMLNLTHPDGDETWVRGFCDGFSELSRAHGVALIGGDTTRGPLNVGISVGGPLAGRPMLRSGAKPGQALLVSGNIGDGAVGLSILKGDYQPSSADRDYCLERLHRPRPHLAESGFIRDIAHSAIDVSDGLLADIRHVLTASSVGVVLDSHRIPLSQPVNRYLESTGDLGSLLSGGDDYVLCFTVDEQDLGKITQSVPPHLQLSRIGTITEQTGELVIRDRQGNVLEVERTGFDHFRP